MTSTNAFSENRACREIGKRCWLRSPRSYRPTRPLLSHRRAPVAKPTLTVKFERKGGESRVARPRAAPRPKRPQRARNRPRSAKQRAPPVSGIRDCPKSGTDLVREWHKGKKYVVPSARTASTFNGKPYRSLSALAKHITGQIVNGFSLVPLGKYRQGVEGQS